jgi:EAL domain-containing protein (putative c-di-GMP-specific phosphodiesterase class I)
MSVRSTIDLAHNLGVRIVADGVEDAETPRWLTDHRCELAQSYRLGRPLPPKPPRVARRLEPCSRRPQRARADVSRSRTAGAPRTDPRRPAR